MTTQILVFGLLGVCVVVIFFLGRKVGADQVKRDQYVQAVTELKNDTIIDKEFRDMPLADARKRMLEKYSKSS